MGVGGTGFDVRVHRLDGVDYVVVDGDVDIDHVSTLRSALDPVAGSQPTLLLDLTPVTFIDSIGIAELIAAHRTATARGAELVVACGPKTERILTMVGLAGVLGVQPSADKYLAERGLSLPLAEA